MSKLKFAPCRQAALQHESAIDPFGNGLTLQTFDDNQDRKSRKLIKVLHGSVRENFDTLVDLNKQGAGVYVTVNQTDLRGRKTKNITNIRAIWQENDGEGKTLPIKPHLSIESSPNKFHNYFFTDCADIREFAPVQERLVKDYGSDPNAKDLPRVLRLAGFYHQKVNEAKGIKRNPFLVSIKHHEKDSFLEWDALKKIFPPIHQKTMGMESKNGICSLAPLDYPSSQTIEELRSALLFLARTEVS